MSGFGNGAKGGGQSMQSRMPWGGNPQGGMAQPLMQQVAQTKQPQEATPQVMPGRQMVPGGAKGGMPQGGKGGKGGGGMQRQQQPWQRPMYNPGMMGAF